MDNGAVGGGEADYRHPGGGGAAGGPAAGDGARSRSAPPSPCGPTRSSCQDRVGRDGETLRFLKFRTLPKDTDPYASKYDIADRPDPALLGGAAPAQARRAPAAAAGARRQDEPRRAPAGDGRRSRRTSSPRHVRGTPHDAPGCTGLWQISAQSKGLICEAPEFDRYYVEHRSLRLDAWILLHTLLFLVPSRQRPHQPASTTSRTGQSVRRGPTPSPARPCTPPAGCTACRLPRPDAGRLLGWRPRGRRPPRTPARPEAAEVLGGVGGRRHRRPDLPVASSTTCSTSRRGWRTSSPSPSRASPPTSSTGTGSGRSGTATTCAVRSSRSGAWRSSACVLSTIAVTFVDNRTDWPPAIMAANLAGFGVLWVAKF